MAHDNQVIESPLSHFKPLTDHFVISPVDTGYESETLDWRARKDEKVWRRLCTEGTTVRDEGLLRPQDVGRLHDAFGLAGYVLAPAFEEIRTMPPMALIQLRRKREWDEKIRLHLIILNSIHDQHSHAECYY